MRRNATQAVVRSYHDGWTRHDFARATALLADDLEVEVPINEYETAEAFGDAVSRFGAMARSVDLLAEMYAGDEAMLLYDMDVEGLGMLRVAEHFTVGDGRIRRIRQIHDTAALRGMGAA